jgi:putative ABC transport system permease protein
MMGVALGVILVVLTVGLARGLMRDYVDRQSNVDAEIRFFPGNIPSLSSNSLALPVRYRDAILNGVQPTPESPDVVARAPVAGIAAATPIGEWVQSGVGGIGFELVDGIDYPSFVQTTHLDIVEGRPFQTKTDGSENFEALVDRFYSQQNKGLDGQAIHFGSAITVFGHAFTVVGIYEPSVLARVKIPLATMQQLLAGGADFCTYMNIRTAKPGLEDEVKASLEEYYPGNKIILTRDLPALYSRSITIVEVFLDVVIGLSTVISTLVILLAMYTTIIERTREIGILKSLGASKGFIVAAIEKEALLISVLGIAVGFLASVAGKYVIEANTRLKIDIQPTWVITAALIGLLGGVLGALYPALRAAGLDPIESLSYSD